MARDAVRFLQPLFLPVAQTNLGSPWQPPADVYRMRTGWLVKFDLAGVRPEDVRLTVSGRSLTVHGTRRDWCVEEGCHYHHMEIAYSRFERCIDLPVELDPARLETSYRDGMLLVRIPAENCS